MSEQPPPTEGVSPNLYRIDELCDRFEQEWLADERPAIENYLGSVGLSDRSRLLRELLLLERELRSQEETEPLLEEYRRRFPEDTDWIEELLVIKSQPDEETRIHDGSGNSPTRPLGPAPEAGLRFGRYELLEVVGKGGMGVVYKARQLGLDRLVALKMILHLDRASRDDLLRFEREAQAIGKLEHTNIVRIHEIGEQDGVPFFSLELVTGGNLSERLKQNPLSPDESARLVETLARAMHAAHEKGVIHRDLKPANVLLAEDGTPKITDFGLARRLDEVGQTQTGDVMGTPSYLAPEQAVGDRGAVGPATDVYALGAILYECLSGRPPFRAATVMETVLQVRSQDPVSLCQLQPSTPKDLETICAKCLEKDPARRYSSAEELAEELRRYRQGEPIQARPVGSLGRAAKWVRRQPALATVLVLAVLVVFLLPLGIIYYVKNREAEDNAAEAIRQRNQAAKQKAEAIRQSNRANQQRAEAIRQKGRAEANERNAQKQRERAERLVYGNRIQLAQQLLERGDSDAARDVLSRTRWDFRDWEYRHLIERFDPTRLIGHTGPVNGVAYSPDGRRLATGSGRPENAVRVWDLTTGKLLRTLGGHARGVTSVAFSPDGKWVASGSDDNTIRLWDIETGEPVRTLSGHRAGVKCVAFGPGGRFVASGSGDKTVRLWESKTGRPVFTLGGHTCTVHGVAFSPDGKLLASASGVRPNFFREGRPLDPNDLVRDNVVKLWDVSTGKEIRTLTGHSDQVHSVAFSPDGKRLVSGSGDKTARVWDVETGDVVLTLWGHTAGILGVAFSPEGSLIATASFDKTVRVWDGATGKAVGVPRAHTGFVAGVAFRPDGKQLASGSRDRVVNVWDSLAGRRVFALDGYLTVAHCVALSPDGRRVAACANRKKIKVWDAVTGEEVLSLEGGDFVSVVAFGRGGKWLASAGTDGAIRLWDARTGKLVRTIREHPGGIASLAFSPDDELIVSGGVGVGVKLWKVATGEELPPIQERVARDVCVAFSPDGKRVAAGSSDETVRVWDVESGRLLFSLCNIVGPITCVAFSGDGRRIAAGTHFGALELWDAHTGRLESTLVGHSGPIFAVCFLGNRRVVSGGWDKTARVWDTETGQPVLTFPATGEHIRSIAVSGDGRRVASSGGEGGVRVWDSFTGPAFFDFEKTGSEVPLRRAGFDATGEYVVGIDAKGARIVWDARTGRLLRNPESIPEPGPPVGPDGKSRVVIEGPHAKLVPDPTTHEKWLAERLREMAPKPEGN